MPNFRRKGFATESTEMCKNFAFENKFAESLISIIHTENTSSEKVAQKNGMKKEKITEYQGMQVNIFRINLNDWKTV